MSFAKKTNTNVYERPNHSAWLHTIREQDEFCDVTIKVGNKKIRAHRLVLAATINYFHRMFLGDFEERKKDVISIDNFNEENMEAIITFSYTGKITFTKENAMDLLKAADFFELTDVKDNCIKFLKSNLDTKNVIAVFHLAKLLPGCISLLERSKTFIRQNLRDVSLTDDYSSVDVEFLESILSRKVPPIFNSEIIFEAIMRWILTDVDSNMTHLPELLRHVSLFSLSTNFLISVLFKDEFRDSLGAKHKEVVAEVLSALNELKINDDSKNSTPDFGATNSPTNLPVSMQPGTSIVKFKPTQGTDLMIKNGRESVITVGIQCITCMKEYESKSLEELRFEDYTIYY